MNQPTREEFEQLKKELKEEVRQLREQITEPLKVTRIEVASEDVIRRLDDLKQELHTISNTWLNTLQEHYTEHKQDISDVQTVQKGHSKYFEEHGKRLAATASKEDITELKATQSDHGELLKNTASKDDLRKLEARIDEHSQLLREILRRLPE